jgi:hypothetical protein
MNGPTITGLGSHYSATDCPEITIRKVRAGGTFAVGDLVIWNNETDSSSYDDGVSVIIGAATKVPVGVALTAGTAGGYAYIQTGGLGLVNIDTDGSTDIGDMLVTGAAGAGVGIALGSTLANYGCTVAALCLNADSSNVQLKGTYILMCNAHS